MKRITILFLFLSLVYFSFAQTLRTIGPSMSIHAQLNQPFEGYPEGTPVTICGIVQTKGGNKMKYAVLAEINQTRFPLSDKNIKVLTLQPETPTEYWQSVYIQKHLFKWIDGEKAQKTVRRKLTMSSQDYLYDLSPISYANENLTDYVQTIFAQQTPAPLVANRMDKFSICLVQSPNPDAYMLPNGALIISTGLLSILDSEEELTAIIANEIAHYVLDHPVNNVLKSEKRSRNLRIFGIILAGVADFSRDVAWAEGSNRAAAVSVVASIGSIAALISSERVDRLGIAYSSEQEAEADGIVTDYLRFKGMNTGAMSSALSKIRNFYQLQKKRTKLPRYGTVKQVEARLKSLNQDINLQSEDYHRKTAEVVTYTAAMYRNNGNYSTAGMLAYKNIDNQVASEDDYVIYVQSKMEQANTPESNAECLAMIREAKKTSETPVLDTCKQEILLLLRMNQFLQASDVLKEYQALLADYKPSDKEEKEWVVQEENWVKNQLVSISQ